MSSLALMRWLEGSPQRYDAGMRLLTFGRVRALHAAVAEAAATRPGTRVLEVGCGTGTVTALLQERSAVVTAIDQSPEMLALARARLQPDSAPHIEWREQTAAEIDALPEESYDAVVLCLSLSDMSKGERSFVLKESLRRLVRGGRLIAADEVRAPAGWRHIAQLSWRVPQAVLGWLLVGLVSRPVPDLAAEVRAAGLRVASERTWLLGSLSLVVAERPA